SRGFRLRAEGTLLAVSRGLRLRAEGTLLAVSRGLRLRAEGTLLRFLVASAFRRKKLETARVDGHAGHGVDADARQPVDVGLRGDAARRGHVTRGGRAHRGAGVAVDALHQSLDVDVGEQELAEERC